MCKALKVRADRILALDDERPFGPQDAMRFDARLNIGVYDSILPSQASSGRLAAFPHFRPAGVGALEAGVSPLPSPCAGRRAIEPLHVRGVEDDSIKRFRFVWEVGKVDAGIQIQVGKSSPNRGIQSQIGAQDRIPCPVH